MFFSIKRMLLAIQLWCVQLTLNEHLKKCDGRYIGDLFDERARLKARLQELKHWTG